MNLSIDNFIFLKIGNANRILFGVYITVVLIFCGENTSKIQSF